MYKIGDFSNKTGLSIKTLRYYDEIDLLKPSYIDNFTGYRYYENYQVKDANLISRLKELSLSLEEIKEYLETRDENILIRKEEEFKKKMEEIKKYMKENNYKIIKSTYEEFIEWNGKRMETSPISLEIRDKNAIYYIRFKDDEFYSDFEIWINEENLIKLHTTSHFEEFYEIALSILKKQYNYEYISIRILEKDYGKPNYILDNYKIIDKKEFDEIPGLVDYKIEL